MNFTWVDRDQVAGTGFESSQSNLATSPIGRQRGSTRMILTLAAALQDRYSSNDRPHGTI